MPTFDEHPIARTSKVFMPDRIRSSQHGLMMRMESVAPMLQHACCTPVAPMHCGSVSSMFLRGEIEARGVRERHETRPRVCARLARAVSDRFAVAVVRRVGVVVHLGRIRLVGDEAPDLEVVGRVELVAHLDAVSVVRDPSQPLLGHLAADLATLRTLR